MMERYGASAPRNISLYLVLTLPGHGCMKQAS